MAPIRERILFVFAVLLSAARAQYEKYSFRSFPQNDLMSLESAYGNALELYSSQDWRQSARYLELSLRLYRLLKDSEAHCGQSCYDENKLNLTDSSETFRIMTHVITRATCLKECKSNLSVFSETYPKRGTLDAFEQRIPYRYLYYVYYQINELEKAVSAAYTYLQRNPGDPLLSKTLTYYKSMYDMEEDIKDSEEKPYEALFLRSVKLYNSGDFSSSVREMELAATEYFKAYNTCLLICEGSHELQKFQDFYPTLADFYLEVLKCKSKCEQNLTPNVGGYFVEKFVATMYHYLQFAYYKLNDVLNAAPCAASYILFDAEDQVMQQNIAYYKYYKEQWGLQDEHFLPRPEALQYYNLNQRQKELLEFSESYLAPDDEDIVSLEASMSAPSHPPDEEFEGIGDYEESFLARWWQEPKTKGDTGEE